MATNEIIDKEYIWTMSKYELSEHLIECGFSEEIASTIQGMARIFLVKNILLCMSSYIQNSVL